MPLKTQENLLLTHNKNNSNRHGKSPQIVCNFKSKGILVQSNVTTLLLLQRKTRLQNINKLTVKLILNQNYPELTK